MNSLSHREWEILVHLCNNMSRKEIANREYVSLRTVDFHLGNIYKKMKVNNRLKAIRKAESEPEWLQEPMT